MIPDEKPQIGIGHNFPPSPIDALKADIAVGLVKYEKRAGEIVESATKKLVTDRISAGQAGDILKIGRQVFDRVDADRKEIAAPYRSALEAASAQFDEFWQPARAALNALRERLDAWTDAEDARIEAQRLEQLKAEREMRERVQPALTTEYPPCQSLAAASNPLPAKRTKIRGDLGATVTRAEDRVYRVVDVRAVPDWILNTSTVHDAIIAVVKSTAKHNAATPGVEFDTVNKNQIR